MKRILVVDDSGAVVRLLKVGLKSAGYDVDEAGNAVEAMKKIEANTYDCGIFDFNMPGKNGIELLKDVLAHPRGKGMRVIMLTTESSNEMKEAGRAAGAAGWLVKPFKNEALIATIEKVLG